MVPFGGWDMPVEYSGIAAEHMAVRERAGLFDVSHMGEIEIAGKDALAAVQRISCNDARKLQVGQAQLSGLLTPSGTFVDDLLVYRSRPSAFPARRERLAHPATTTRTSPSTSSPAGDAVAVDVELALRAARRSGSERARQSFSRSPLSIWRRSSTTGSRTAKSPVCGPRSREPGTPARMDSRSWFRLSRGPSVCGSRFSRPAVGRSDPLRPRRARHVAARSLDAPARQRHRRDDHASRGGPWRGSSAGTKPDFVGADALRRQKETGVTPRKLVGFEMLDRGIARHGHEVYVGDAKAGTVTSGTQTPYLKKAIGMAYVPVAHAAAGTEFGRRHSWRRRARWSRRCRSTNGAAADRSVDSQRPRSSGDNDGLPRGLQVHQGSRVDRCRRRPRQGRHHRLCAAAARRCRLSSISPRSERGLKAGQSFGTHRIGQGGSELYAPVAGEVVEVNTGAQGEAGSRQHRPARQLDDRDDSSPDPGEADALLDATAVRRSW